MSTMGTGIIIDARGGRKRVVKSVQIKFNLRSSKRSETVSARLARNRQRHGRQQFFDFVTVPIPGGFRRLQLRQRYFCGSERREIERDFCCPRTFRSVVPHRFHPRRVRNVRIELADQKACFGSLPQKGHEK